MRVAMILGASLGMLPWNYFYLDELLKYGCAVTVISWNREGVGNEEIDERVVIKEYKEKIDNSISKMKKIAPFLKFRKYATKILNENIYDMIIISTLQEALLFIDYLKYKYSGRYIYDVRDPWYERKTIIYYLSNQIVKDSAITFISSEAFKRWLPNEKKIVVTHNVRFQDKQFYRGNDNVKKTSAIRIVFWGITREVETNIKFIQLIANDIRFELEYYGVLLEESKAIFNYCKKNGIKNVSYKGSFPKDGRIEIAQNTDMIHDIYCSEKEKFDTRMFNKYYDGIVFEIPQIVYSQGFVGQCVDKYGVGISIALQEGDADRIYNYYINLDRQLFHKNCQKEQKRIKKEMEWAREKLDETILRFQN